MGNIRALNITNLPSSKNNPGKFAYFSIHNNVQIELSRGIYDVLTKNNCSIIELVCSVDGLPLFNNVSGQFWPILGMVYVKNLRTESFVIALFYGDSKPGNLHKYLVQFIDEVNHLEESGIKNISNNIFISSKIYCVRCSSQSNIKMHQTPQQFQFV